MESCTNTSSLLFLIFSFKTAITDLIQRGTGDWWSIMIHQKIVSQKMIIEIINVNRKYPTAKKENNFNQLVQNNLMLILTENWVSVPIWWCIPSHMFQNTKMSHKIKRDDNNAFWTLGCQPQSHQIAGSHNCRTKTKTLFLLIEC